MISFIVAVIAFVFVLGFVVALHEFGHFYFARKAGILCPEFAIGMGPVIYRVKKGETYYSIRAIPIGGFVSMSGEDLNELALQNVEEVSIQLDNNQVTEIILDKKIDGQIKGRLLSYDVYGKENKELYLELEVNKEINKYYLAEECYYVLSQREKIRVAPYDRCFESKTVMQRFLAIVAGPVMNLILALFLFLIVGLASGVATNENIIGTVVTDTAKEYLLEGDIIIDIGGYPIEEWSDVSSTMAKMKELGEDYIFITYIRNGDEYKKEVKANIQINSVGITNIGSDDDYTGSGIVLGELANGNKAYEAGLKQNDILTMVTINNIDYDIDSFKDLMDLFEDDNKNLSVSFTYIRDGETATTKNVEPFDNETLEKLGVANISYTIGISPTTKFSFFGGIANGLSLTWSNATMIFTTLTMIVSPSSQISVSDLSGPGGIFGLVQSYLDAGFIVFLSLIGMLSIYFFVVNLLPFPALDGGRLVFIGYEAITKKPVNKKIENMVNSIGFALLLILMLYVTFNDLLRI